jgi:hypothetical protein
MLEELQRRNYSENTTRCYIHTVEDFAPLGASADSRISSGVVSEYEKSPDYYKDLRSDNPSLIAPLAVVQGDEWVNPSLCAYSASSARAINCSAVSPVWYWAHPQDPET